MKSWDGGENTIDSSKLEGEGGRRERDSWDADLDKGKVRLKSNSNLIMKINFLSTSQVKKVKKAHHGSQFNSERNCFQEFQNQRNVSP